MRSLSCQPALAFVVPAIDHRFMLACTFADQKYAERCPDHQVLIRAFVGGALHQDDLACSDEEMIERLCEELQWRFHITVAPVATRIARWPQAMAQHTIGHQSRLAKIRALEATLPGLALIGNGYEGVGLPDIISQAESAIERLSQQTKES